MDRLKKIHLAVVTLVAAVVASVAAFGITTSASADERGGEVTSMFQGVKANTGTATHRVENGKHILSLSKDFEVPDSPDPHWQVVDSKGNVHLLQKLTIKPDKLNETIVLPGYVADVAKVQMWCAWAEVLLGEASFEKPVLVAAR